MSALATEIFQAIYIVLVEAYFDLFQGFHLLYCRSLRPILVFNAAHSTEKPLRVELP